MRRFLILSFAVFLLAAYSPTDAERARWTMHDMQSWRIALAAYKQDHGTYPDAKTLEEARTAIEPKYIRHSPVTDAWGNAYGFERTGDGFRVVSAGADGKFDPPTWTAAGRQSSFDADAVATNDGRWLYRFWEMK